MANLYVNVDHVATVRQARRVHYPDPVHLARLAEEAGVHGITVHLREDRRHILDDDVRRLRRQCRTPLNLELAVAEEILRFAEDVHPDQATIVPERREEVTTEGGLALNGNLERIRDAVARLQRRSVVVSLFIDPLLPDLDVAKAVGATHVELHTGRYAGAVDDLARSRELAVLAAATAHGRAIGLVVNAGHGLHYENTAAVAALPGIHDLNIGHAIVAKALEIGMPAAIHAMLALVHGGDKSRAPAHDRSEPTG